MITRLFLICTVSFAMVGGAHGQTTPPYPHENLYYYNGDSKLNVVLALDELHVEGEKGQPLNTRSMAAAGFWNMQTIDTATLRMSGAASRANLQAQANAIDATGTQANAILYQPESAQRTVSDQQILTHEFSVKLRDPSELDAILTEYNLSVVRTVTYSPNTYIVSAGDSNITASLEAANALYEAGQAEFATPLIQKQRPPRLIPNDPLFSSQWHLQNTGQAAGSVAGHDVNIVDAWDLATGAGINIAVVDTGVHVLHPDISPNARTDIDIDIQDGDNNPTPNIDSHGTSVAGIAAARGNNGIGVTGAAFEAGIVGVRLIEQFSITDQEEADALGHQINAASNLDVVHISNNSWGPTDNGTTKAPMGPLTEAAMANAVSTGRGGKGTIYVWAGGNGRGSGDNVNYDGYATSRYTIAVGASGGAGLVSYYSEPGASLLVNTPSSYVSAGTVTTANASSYTSGFGGTSSASPLAAGIVALMLDVNPNLTWRDVQHILVQTSTKNDFTDIGWVQNGANLFFHHDYGFGRINALAAVNMSGTWLNIPEATSLSPATSVVNLVIPDNNVTGIAPTQAVSGPGSFVTEHVEVIVDIDHTRRGQLRIDLISPSGTVSKLSEVHGDPGDDFPNWKFMSVANWGEDPNGTWTLRIIDGLSGDEGTLNSWKITVYGNTTANLPVPTLKVPFFTPASQR